MSVRVWGVHGIHNVLMQKNGNPLFEESNKGSIRFRV